MNYLGPARDGAFLLEFPTPYLLGASFRAFRFTKSFDGNLDTFLTNLRQHMVQTSSTAQRPGSPSPSTASPQKALKRSSILMR